MRRNLNVAARQAGVQDGLRFFAEPHDPAITFDQFLDGPTGHPTGGAGYWSEVLLGCRAEPDNLVGPGADDRGRPLNRRWQVYRDLGRPFLLCRSRL